MADDHIKKIDGMNDRLIRIEERLPLQIDHLSDTITDFRGEIGDAIRDLSAAIKAQAALNDSFQGMVSEVHALTTWRSEMDTWKDRLNKYLFATAVVATIVIWLLNQFIGPLITRLWK